MHDDNKRRFGHRLRHVSIRGRLVALVVLPILGLATVAWPLTADRLQQARTGVAVLAGANRLAQQVALRSGVHSERVAVEAVLRARAFGLTSEQASAMLGFDILAVRAESEQRADSAAAALPAGASPIDMAALHNLRARARTAATADVDTLVAEYRGLDARLREVMNTTFDQIRLNIAADATNTELASALDAVRAATDVLDALNDQMNSLLSMLLTARSTGSLVQLAEARTRADIGGRQLDTLHSSELAQRWRQISDGPQLAHVRAAVAAALAGPAPDSTPDDPVTRLAGISRDGLDAERQLYGYINTSGTIIRTQATLLSQQAATDLARTAYLNLAAVVVMALVSTRLLRSVRAPLRRLRIQADAVSNGTLDLEPLGDDGPSDVSGTMAAFDDLVANLRLLEAKAKALAACEFDAPVLAHTVPGPLGQSLQRSVQVLFGSIVERDELQMHLAYQATHDPLTGLYNRTAATTTLEQVLRRTPRGDRTVAVLFIDLDDFKPINDVHGHPVGDAVLCHVASRVRTAVGATDFLARLGGDEFVVITEAVEDPARVVELAHQVIDAVSQPVAIDDLTVRVGASVGIAFSADGREDADQLLTWADLAVNRAKQRGPGRTEVYNRHMQEDLVARATIRDALTDGIRRGELYLDYQPVYATDDARLRSVEALVRWNRPGFGVQNPDTFIPAAEDSGRLIIELDCWVLNEAARQLKMWEHDPDMGTVDVSVNISGRHVANRELVDHVTEVLERSGINPDRLVLEITETVLPNDLDVAAEQLNKLRALGIRIAIDDFGTGYTSVTHLAQLPVDILKVDRSFLRNSLSQRDRSLLAMIINLGHHLGLAITAEGVETEEHLQLLRQLTCDQAQGFLLGPPVPATDLCVLDRRHAPASGMAGEVWG
jgi:diguanylate cyclase (GGDEF)-like protein